MTATPRTAPDVAAPAPSGAGPDAPGGMLWYVALGLLLVATAAMMLYLTRGLTFNLDEWTVVTERRGAGAPSLLEPHNEHLSVLVLAVFLALVRLGGVDAQALMMVPLIALQLGLGVLLFVIARRRVGAGVAVGVAAFALLSGLAYENFLLPGQAGQMASIVAGVAAFAVLDRPPSRRDDWLLAGLMVVAITASGMGIPVLVGIAVELALTAAGRRRLWVVAVPFALYVLWYAAYGNNRAAFDELALSALWAWTAANHAAGAIIGERQIEPGRDLLIVLLVVLAYRAWKVQPPARIRMAALATILVTFYGLTAISRHDIAPPSSSRYLTVGLVLLLLLLVEAARGWRVRRWVPYLVLVLALLAFVKTDGSAQALRDGRALFLDRSQQVRASLGAVALLGRERIDPDFEIAPLAAPFLLAGPWFDTLAALPGDPGYSAAEVARASPPARMRADQTLIRAGGLALGPARARGSGACRRPWAGDRGLVPATGVRVLAGTARTLTLRARRFGNEPLMVGVLPIPRGHAVELHPLADASRVPYILEADGAAAVCRL